MKIKPDETHLLQDNHHYRDFLDCVLTRRTPVSNIDSAVQSDFISHLGDIAIRTVGVKNRRRRGLRPTSRFR